MWQTGDFCGKEFRACPCNGVTDRVYCLYGQVMQEHLSVRRDFAERRLHLPNIRKAEAKAYEPVVFPYIEK